MEFTRSAIQTLILLLVGCHLSLQQIPVTVLTPRNALNMQQGLGWPRQLNVVEGHEALLKVQGRLENMESCVIVTPTGVQFDVQSPPSNRYEAWSDSCGVRVRNVVEADEGRWRITATAGNDTLVGWSIIIVDKDTTSYSGPEIELLDGKSHTEVELTTLNNAYCMVAQPFSESSLVPGHCRVTLDRATRAVQGNWNILLGLPGKVQELPVQRRVAVEAERLDMGYIRDTTAGKLHLYCNILNTEKNITFCRFHKTTSSIGYNVVDGLSDGVHSYYGDGFLVKHCGMTIEQPTTQDYGTWRCSVGVQQLVGSTIQQQTPLQALISVGPDSNRLGRGLTHRVEEDEPPTVFVQEDQTFTVMCRADESLSYCWFQHPNGTAFTPAPIQTEDQLFWYTGENLQVGDCGITLTHATPEETGLWTCHMGPREMMGVEITDRVEVRVTGPLAANKKIVSTYIGDSVNLHCHTSNGNKPLDYCRFLTPQAVGFRIDSTVTEDNAILGRYFFMANRSLDYGDCALTIRHVQEEDLGQWTCAALINDDLTEAWDTLNVTIASGSRAPLSRAGIAGMAIGASVLLVTLIGVALYKTGYVRMPAWRNRRTESERFALGSLSTAARGSMTNSENSVNSSEVTVSELGEVLAGNNLSRAQ